MHKTAVLGALTLAVSNAALTGYSQSLDVSVRKSGTHEGQSQPTPDGQRALIKFAAKGRKVITAKFTIADEHGRPHDGEYGKIATGRTDGKFYQHAQCTVGAESQYTQKFVETPNADKVEMIAGASIFHGLFQSAIEGALGECGQTDFAFVRFWQVELSSTLAHRRG